MLCGGTSDALPVDDDVRAICEKIKPHVEAKLGETLDHFEPKSYKRQVVAGMNYFVKVHTHPDSGHHVHLRVYKDLKGELSLHSLQEKKTHEDPIEYF